MIHQNATSLWNQAITTGNSTYDPSGSVSLYFSAARFYQVVLLYIVPFLVENVKAGLATSSKIATQNFINTAVQNQNATAFMTANLAPQTLATAFSFHRYDVRPITVWASAAWFEAALIYFTIFFISYDSLWEYRQDDDWVEWEIELEEFDSSEVGNVLLS